MICYCLHVPTHGNSGEPLDDLHEYVRNVLAVDFGGCTIIDAEGAWPGAHYIHDEPVRLYLTYQPDDSAWVAGEMRQLAVDVKVRAAQEAVCLTEHPIAVHLI